ncbi:MULTISPECIES: DUF6414 family protein [Sporosarcina]|uniref:Uncharacterized protein n=1 Tax=Sporosarcina newyorkensis TaxID=759851 RepID=A0A1T4XF56_9BACL|nr:MULTISPECIES: hypothetical protein [Sporosarcina]MBY0222741.1 hypothetical protein [Sporosarcina aquimarina]SKA87675.1 hypothetical protein SAMN04244570_0546 [Sporosarcina newyorkensis]
MKEIIYLDTEIMNSLLAQLDEGLVHSFTLENSGEETESEEIQTTRGKESGITAGVKVSTGMLPGGEFSLGTNLGNSGEEANNYSKTILEGQKDILNKAFHDYSLDLLIKKLTENDLLTENGKLKESDLHLGESKYRFYDFNLIKKSLNADFLENMMLDDVKKTGMSYETAKKIVSKPYNPSQDQNKRTLAEKVYETHEQTQHVVNTISLLNKMSDFSSDLLDRLVVIKANDKIGLLKKDMLRESVESLTFRTDKNRNIRYLVRILGEKEIVYDGITNMPMLDGDSLDIIPTMMLDIILGNFNIIKKGDVLVTPIAIYYE